MILKMDIDCPEDMENEATNVMKTAHISITNACVDNQLKIPSSADYYLTISSLCKQLLDKEVRNNAAVIEKIYGVLLGMKIISR